MDRGVLLATVQDDEKSQTQTEQLNFHALETNNPFQI